MIDESAQLETFFCEMAESRLLEQLAQQRHLSFAADAPMLAYLRRYYSDAKPGNKYGFHLLDSGTDEVFLDAQGPLLVASLQHEDAFFSRVHAKGQDKYRLFSDVFVNLAAGVDLFQTVRTADMADTRNYALVTTPRSGSTLICQMLEALGTAGHPNEHLRHPTQALCLHHSGFDYIRYLQALMRTKATPNKVFGTKLIAHFLEKHRATDTPFQQILDHFKFIHLVRRDQVAQAVSLFIARHINIWHVHNEQAEAEYQRKLKALTVNDETLYGVHLMHREILREEDYLKDFFQRYGLQPLYLEYEEFVADPRTHMDRILGYIGVQTEYDVEALRPSSQRLRTGLNKAFAQAYRQAYADWVS